MASSQTSAGNSLNSGRWWEEEDQKLKDYMRSHNNVCWERVPFEGGLRRDGKSCRRRWCDQLSPNINKGKFTAEEDQQIISLHRRLGNSWSTIARLLPGRTGNQIKNQCRTRLKNRLLQEHIDPSPDETTSGLNPCMNLSQLTDTSYSGHFPTNEDTSVSTAVGHQATGNELMNDHFSLLPRILAYMESVMVVENQIRHISEESQNLVSVLRQIVCPSKWLGNRASTLQGNEPLRTAQGCMNQEIEPVPQAPSSSNGIDNLLPETDDEFQAMIECLFS